MYWYVQEEEEKENTYLLQAALIPFGMICQNVILGPANRLPLNQERDVRHLDQPQTLRAEDWERKAQRDKV